MADAKGAASVALDGFVHLLASQVLTRLFTFTLNLLTARSLTPQAYGVAAVQFHLINTSILLLAREGVRRATLRVEAGTPRATRRVLGAALWALPAGAALSAGVTAALLVGPARGQDAAYRTAVAMQGGAAFLELLSEPLYCLAASRLQFGLRVGAEAAAMVLKSAVTLALLPRLPPALAFSWAQLAYAAATLAAYAAHFAPEALRALRARRQRGSAPAAGGAARKAAGTRGGTDEAEDGSLWPVQDRALLQLAGTFSLQAGGKLVLAEGSKLASAALQGAAGQGVYGLVGNLGSLAVRTLFQPFEEAAFTAFSTAAGSRAKPSAGALRSQRRLLRLLGRVVLLVALAAAAFGPAYSHLLLLLAYTSKWADSEAPAALGLYSQYTVLLALNGVLEAFVHGVADAAGLGASNRAMVALSAAHVALSAAGVRAAGAAGLIAADGAAMALRIAYCVRFAQRHFAPVDRDGGGGRFGLRELAPSGATLAAYAAALAVTSASRLALLPESSGLLDAAAAAGGSPWAAAVQQLRGAAAAAAPFRLRAAAHVGVGAASLAAVAAVVLLRERSAVRELRELRKGSKRD